MTVRLTIGEINSMMYSEYYVKRGALFYFAFHEGKNQGVYNGMAPNSTAISMASVSSTGFVWERDHIMPRFCPEDADQMYDYISNLCLSKSIRILNVFFSEENEILVINILLYEDKLPIHRSNRIDPSSFI